MYRVFTGLATISWLSSIVIVAVNQGLAPLVVVPMLLGVAGLAMTAARAVRYATKHQRSALSAVLLGPAIVGAATTPMYGFAPVTAFVLLAVAFVVVTVVIGVLGERNLAEL